MPTITLSESELAKYAQAGRLLQSRFGSANCSIVAPGPGTEPNQACVYVPEAGRELCAPRDFGFRMNVSPIPTEEGDLFDVIVEVFLLANPELNLIDLFLRYFDLFYDAPWNSNDNDSVWTGEANAPELNITAKFKFKQDPTIIVGVLEAKIPITADQGGQPTTQSYPKYVTQTDRFAITSPSTMDIADVSRYAVYDAGVSGTVQNPFAIVGRTRFMPSFVNSAETGVNHNMIITLQESKFTKDMPGVSLTYPGWSAKLGVWLTPHHSSTVEMMVSLSLNLFRNSNMRWIFSIAKEPMTMNAVMEQTIYPNFTVNDSYVDGMVHDVDLYSWNHDAAQPIGIVIAARSEAFTGYVPSGNNKRAATTITFGGRLVSSQLWSKAFLRALTIEASAADDGSGYSILLDGTNTAPNVVMDVTNIMTSNGTVA